MEEGELNSSTVFLEFILMVLRGVLYIRMGGWRG